MRRLSERQKKRKNFPMKIYDIAPIDAYSEFLDGHLTVAMRALTRTFQTIRQEAHAPAFFKKLQSASKESGDIS